ncbi:TPA: lipid IV(A) 3-deoxy-D-manno-octulosonic acid transferase [Vibrio cholerae]|nr:3-deoxy-D-manno-octulosonic-acid transferase [Vibrio cholerae]HDZ9289794.1 lipid IV(A) 3-deoxy-D-manno-octulosonic acid transferase [Vibrio cholerae]
MLIRWLYTLLLTLASPFLMWGLYKQRDGKPLVGSRWKEHFGITPPLESHQSPIWIHAVSVGETLAVSPLIKAIKLQYPDQAIVITTTTATGAEQAAKLSGLAEHRYMPFDFSFAVRGFLRRVKPSQLLIMETELWPNTLYTVNQAGIPISVINARLSERSCQRYAKFQPIFNLLATQLTQILCQYPEDAQRFIRLGVAKDKVTVTGSIKFDIHIEPETVQQGLKLRRYLGPHRPIWIAASTHQGEDELILDTHAKLLKSHPNGLLILVPRHPERFNSVFELCKKRFICARRTQSSDNFDANTQIYLGDTMGELLVLIGAADICFMGGSLLGNKVGGHNVLEPAALHKPIISGPSYYNFSVIVKRMLDKQAITIVGSADEIYSSLIILFDSKEYQQQKSHLAYQCVQENTGALNRTIRLVMDKNPL